MMGEGCGVQPMLLCFNLTSAHAMPVFFAAMSLGIRPRNVPPERFSQTIGTLCDLDGERLVEKKDAFTDEMLVLAFLDDAQQEKLLAALRQAGVRIPLKAVLTMSNRSWTALQLHDELLREDAAMRAERMK